MHLLHYSACPLEWGAPVPPGSEWSSPCSCFKGVWRLGSWPRPFMRSSKMFLSFLLSLYTHCSLSFFTADSPEERSKYELLCLDGTRKPVEQYASCHLARVSSHAVVARTVDGRADKIWALLSYALVFIKFFFFIKQKSKINITNVSIQILWRTKRIIMY